MNPATRVLIVDDNEQNIYYLRALLTANGCVIDTARDGAEALAAARREPPEMIVSDLLMPVMDGYTLLRHWKADANLKQIPFIVYTATYTEPKDELLALSLGADAFILKPADPEEFVARLRAVQSNAAAAVPLPARVPITDEGALLKTYNETLIRKLEEKSLQLEVTNRALQQDIAVRRQIERALDESRDRLAVATQSAQIGIWDWDVVTNTMVWDAQMYALYGFDKMESGDAFVAWQKGFHPDDRAAAEANITAALDGVKAFHTEFRVVWPGGDVRSIEAHGVVQRADTGVATRMTGVSWDITSRKDAEIRIKYLNRVYAMLSGINSLIVRAHHRDELFEEAGRIAVDDGGFCVSLMGLWDPDTMTFVPVALTGSNPLLVSAINDILSRSAGVPTATVAKVLREKKAFVSNDSQNDPAVAFREQHAAFGVRSMAIFPLLIAGNAVGVLALYATESAFFHDEELKLLTELTNDIAFAIDHLDKKERLDYLAYYDALTGLANRSLFLERVAQYMRSPVSGNYTAALLLIDLERFRNINDTLGRSAGDALLRQVAQWLTQYVGDPGLVARVGADQFCLLVPGVNPEIELTLAVPKMLSAFVNHPFQLNDEAFRVAARVGVAQFPDDASTAENLFRNAEAALKRAKAGGDRFLFYTQQMTDVVAGRLTLENHLRQALEREEFVLHYQPTLSLRSSKLTGAEALLRWNDPRTGLVPPLQFIPILEETGLIHDVGRWALHKAIEDYLRWHAMGLPVVRIAVNVSPLQLRNRRFVAEIRQAIDVAPHAAAGLELEITESVVMEDVKHSIATLHEIRAMGVSIAIDDFGTGFSSLSYLAKLPVDTLKIDRSFVRDMTVSPEGLALVSTIINLARSLRLKVVAEGVETEEQSRLLHLLKCDEMQGFLCSKALPAEDFAGKFLTAPTAG